MDRLLAFLMLILLFPVIIFLILLLGVFKQERPGKNGVIFTIYKIRTMIQQTELNGRKLSDSERMTPIGKWVRKLSLDELPQLWNVLKGDMSFIGPRPLLPRYLSLYSNEQFRRHEVKPGITGWAQINGRNLIGWSEKFNLDIYYVNNISFTLDILIIFLTIQKVIKREGINSNDNVTMGEFKGNINE